LDKKNYSSFGEGAKWQLNDITQHLSPWIRHIEQLFSHKALKEPKKSWLVAQ
jgi:uncharacterized phage-associated protein